MLLYICLGLEDKKPVYILNLDLVVTGRSVEGSHHFPRKTAQLYLNLERAVAAGVPAFRGGRVPAGSYSLQGSCPAFSP